MSEVTPWRKLRFYQRLARIGLGIMAAGAVVGFIDTTFSAALIAFGLIVFAVAASIAET